MQSDDELALLVCGLDKVSVNPVDEEVRFILPPGHSCDMSGAIRLAKRYLPSVRRVHTWAPGDRYSVSAGTVYHRRPSGWHVQRI